MLFRITSQDQRQIYNYIHVSIFSSVVCGGVLWFGLILVHLTHVLQVCNTFFPVTHYSYVKMSAIVSHRRLDCLLNSLLMPRSATSTHCKWELMLYCLHCLTLNEVFLLLLLLKNTSKLRVTNLCEGNSPVTGPRTKSQWRGKCFYLMTSSWVKHLLKFKLLRISSAYTRQ